MRLQIHLIKLLTGFLQVDLFTACMGQEAAEREHHGWLCLGQ